MPESQSPHTAYICIPHLEPNRHSINVGLILLYTMAVT